MGRSSILYAKMALLLMGSALALCSCEKQEEELAVRNEALMTEYSENMTLLVSENGRRSFHFTTPLLEGYTLAKEPYREFRKGVKITTYQDDSLSTVDAVLTANYAINYENRRLWEAKGNVVVKKTDGRTLYTEQLFWNQLTGRIYSNVDTRLVQKDGADDFMSTGFESDEDFSFYNFREMDGKTQLEMPEPGGGDSVSKPRPAATGRPSPERTLKPAASRPERKPELRPAPRPERSSEHLKETAPSQLQRMSTDQTLKMVPVEAEENR